MNQLANPQHSGTKKSGCYTAPRIPMNMWLRGAKQISAPVLLLCATLSLAQQNGESQGLWNTPSRQFVQAILSRAGTPSSVALGWQNKSSVSAADFAQIRRTVEVQFRTAEVRLLSPDRSLAEIQITVSENTRGLLWVAEIKQGTTTQFFMQSVPRPPISPPVPAPTLILKDVPLWSQEDPILDFSQTDANTLLLLDAKQLAILNRAAGKWKLQQSLPITHSRPWPRDLRGRLLVNADQAEVYLPGVKCAGFIGGTPSLACTSSDDPWPLDGTVKAFYSPGRNFFTGVLVTASGDQNVPAFFSSAKFSGAIPYWIFSGTDGRAKMYGDFSTAAASGAPAGPKMLKTISGWGSDIAAIKTNCGSKSQILITQPEDLARADAIQAVEIVNGQEVPVSNPLEFTGSINALWPSSEGTEGNAVLRNASTGMYEAIKITANCGQ